MYHRDQGDYSGDDATEVDSEVEGDVEVADSCSEGVLKESEVEECEEVEECTIVIPAVIRWVTVNQFYGVI